MHGRCAEVVHIRVELLAGVLLTRLTIGVLAHQVNNHLLMLEVILVRHLLARLLDGADECAEQSKTDKGRSRLHFY